MARGIKITYRVPQYSPEQSVFWVNGEIFAPMYSQLAHDLGYLVICGKAKEAEDKIVREVRKSRLERTKVTFGFFKANGSKEFMFTRQLVAYDDDLEDKLRIYKLWKEFCVSKNCDLATHEITSGDFTLKGMKNTVTEESHDIVDITRPIKIRWV